MSKLNTLAGGYKGGSPRVRSENSKKPYVGDAPKLVNVEKLVNDIKILGVSEVNFSFTLPLLCFMYIIFYSKTIVK